jgi:uncharacterized phage-associated protein
MRDPIRFKVSYDKVIETIIWLAKKKPGIDIYHVAKVLFYADKIHINKYARPVIGDTYIKMQNGHAPSAVRDLITENSWLSPKQLEKVKNSLQIGSKTEYYKLVATREPDLNYFSKSDLECLAVSLNKYGELSFDDLYDLTHTEKSYYEAAPNESIDYALLIDNNNPLKDDILEHMKEISEYVQV